MKDMQYQLAFLVSPNLNQSETEDFLKKIESLIQKGGEISQKEELKKIRLAYPIQKEKEAFFGFFEFKTTAEEIEILKTELKKEKNLLRFLIIKREAKKKEQIKRTKKPEIPLEPKEESDEKLKEKKVELKNIEEKIEEIT